jgi:diguanylate cyclase (GGDEF)-like protein/PAS domain S-box-containing protein
VPDTDARESPGKRLVRRHTLLPTLVREGFVSRRTLLALLALASVTVGSAPPASALDPTRAVDEYSLRYWTEENGLPHSSIWALRPTADGYLWLGTQAGLVRWDGIRFTLYDDASSDAFRENAVHALAEGADGTLYVAPIRDELLRRDRNGIVRLPGLLPASWRGHGVGDLLVARDGSLYITANGGLARIRAERNVELLAEAPMPRDLNLVRRRILQDSKGRILWAAPDGVWTLVGGRPRLVARVRDATALLLDHQGLLWVGTNHGELFVEHEGNVDRIRLSLDLGGHRMTSILEDRDHNLWLGTRGGLYRLRYAERWSGRLQRIAVAGVQDLAEDARGGLWVAARSGLLCLRDLAFRSFTPPSVSREVLSLAEDGAGALWFVTVEPPHLWSVTEGKVHAERAKRAVGRALAVHRDDTGTFWLGTTSGLFRRVKDRFVAVRDTAGIAVTAIADGPGQTLWLADDRGDLYREAPGRQKAFGREAGLPGKRISSLHGSRDGSLWVTTYDGVYRYADGRLQEVRLGDRPGYRFARQVTEDAEGRIWISTRAGLVRIAGGAVRTFGRHEGLPDTSINTVLDDRRGNLWLACPSGLLRVAKAQFERLDQGQLARIGYSVLGRSDRDMLFWSSSNAGLLARDGTLWFSTARGPLAVPDRQGPAAPPPPVAQIEEVFVDGGRVAPRAGRLALPAGARHLEIRFGAPSLEAPELLSFRYRLLGYESRWIEDTAHRVAHYTGLPPGSYGFQVEAGTAGGSWSQQAARLDLVLAPLWYQHGWVRGAPWTLVVGLPLLLYRWRLRRHRRRERELEQGVLDRTNELRAEIRARAQVEQALRVSEERYALAVRGTNDGIWDWDLATGKVYYSPGFEAILGYAAGELGDRPEQWLLRIHPEDVDAVQTKLVAAQQSQQAQLEDEHRIRHKDGTLRWTLLRAAVVRNDQGDVARLVGTLSDMTDRRAYDSLTGLPSRLYLVERVRDALNRKKRQPDYCFAVLAVDIDRFDLVTNSLGYQGSDRLLARVAERLVAGLRPSDVVGRFGGDDFVAILDDVADVSEAQVVAKRLQEAIVAPFDLDGKEIFATVSIGIAPGLASYEDPEDLVRDADTALGRAKGWGRARCDVFDERMRLQSTSRLQIEGELRRSCERGELRVRYQPVVVPSSGRIAGFETLVRWQHPSRGLLHPDEFILSAEETGTTVPIGYWVLRKACLQARAWSDRTSGGQAPFVSVNVSARQFAEPDFVGRVQAVLAETNCPPGILHLEITETTLLQANRNVLETLGRLRQLQLHLAVDDFGTGYSSLGYLERFPIDLLKIDRSFMRGMGPHGERQALVRMMVALAKDMDMIAVAEGVETEVQRDILITLGCHLAQGYYFAEALEAEAATVLLEKTPLAEVRRRSTAQASLFN